jgi:hypothetical protein
MTQFVTLISRSTLAGGVLHAHVQDEAQNVLPKWTFHVLFSADGADNSIYP